MKKEIRIICPYCKKRLFDVDPNTVGIVTIKCQVCKSVVAFNFHHNKIRTEQIATQ